MHDVKGRSILIKGSNHTADEQALKVRGGISGEQKFATCPPKDELTVLLSFPMKPLGSGHLRINK